VLSPLQSANLTKPEIRELARNAGLPSWERPQAACLSSRFPTFEPVTVPALSRVDAAERFIHSLGFKQIRVRNHTLAGGRENHGDSPERSRTDATESGAQVLLARLEIDGDEMHRFADDQSLFPQIDAHLKELGYSFVTLDMGGYRRGSGNVAGLKEAAAVSGATNG
jgi:uncharacterized protein